MRKPNPKGVIQIDEVKDFDSLSESDATDLVYNIVVPKLEEHGLMVSSYGNHAGRGSLYAYRFVPDPYEEWKSNRKLFDIKDVQIAYRFIKARCKRSRRYLHSSYSFKHDVEKNQKNSRGSGYFTNGDVLLAILIAGFHVRGWNPYDKKFLVNPDVGVVIGDRGSAIGAPPL